MLSYNSKIRIFPQKVHFCSVFLLINLYEFIHFCKIVRKCNFFEVENVQKFMKCQKGLNHKIESESRNKKNKSPTFFNICLHL